MRVAIHAHQFVTHLARSYEVLRPEIMGYLSSQNCRVVKSKSMGQMNVVMILATGLWTWYVPPAPAQEEDDDEEQEQEQGGYAGGSEDYYRNMSRGDW